MCFEAHLFTILFTQKSLLNLEIIFFTKNNNENREMGLFLIILNKQWSDKRNLGVKFGRFG